MKKLVRNESMLEAGRFLLVGVCNTVLGGAVMFILYNLAKASYFFSSGASIVCGAVLSYFLNRRFTFRFSGGHKKSAPMFFTVVAVCYLISYSLPKLFVPYLLEFSGMGERQLGNIMLFCGMCLYTVLNFLGQKYIAFAGKSKNK